jgi:hypothetical protein
MSGLNLVLAAAIVVCGILLAPELRRLRAARRRYVDAITRRDQHKP